MQHRYFLFAYLANHLPHNRYGFVVSKRLGKAVRRNKIRRRLREAMRWYDPLLTTSLRDGVDVVLVARPAVVGASYQELHAALGHILRQAGLLAA